MLVRHIIRHVRLELLINCIWKHLGQLQTYLQKLDDEVRKFNENPSVGIVFVSGYG